MATLLLALIVDSTSFERYGRQMDVEKRWMLPGVLMKKYCTNRCKLISDQPQDVILTSNQHHLNVVDVWMDVETTYYTDVVLIKETTRIIS